mmetsp:Transcript_7451/g.22925  ORF Transcript_7451/g.22925 Transcript_7451/m.22925 type:complete len:209 (+) Transcript_7451:4465-5091(+)
MVSLLDVDQVLRNQTNVGNTRRTEKAKTVTQCFVVAQTTAELGETFKGAHALSRHLGPGEFETSNRAVSETTHHGETAVKVLQFLQVFGDIDPMFDSSHACGWLLRVQDLCGQEIGPMIGLIDHFEELGSGLELGETFAFQLFQWNVFEEVMIDEGDLVGDRSCIQNVQIKVSSFHRDTWERSSDVAAVTLYGASSILRVAFFQKAGP